MDTFNLIEKMKPRIHAGVEKAIEEIEAKNRRNATLWAGVYAAGDYTLWFEAVKKWESEGCIGNKPKRDDFKGMYYAALIEAEKKKNTPSPEIQAEIEQVEASTKGFVKNFKF